MNRPIGSLISAVDCSLTACMHLDSGFLLIGKSGWESASCTETC